MTPLFRQIAGTRYPDVRVPLPEHVHQGFLPGPDRLPVDVAGSSSGRRVQDRRHRSHPVLPRTQDRGRRQLGERQQRYQRQLQFKILFLEKNAFL